MDLTMNYSRSGLSDEEYSKNMYEAPGEALRYDRKHRSRKRDNLEEGCIAQGLSRVPKESLVFDLPCGTGKLTWFIRKMGYRVCAADYSESMLDVATQRYPDESGESLEGNSDVWFEKQDITAITHPDDAFDATVCNRLLHHFPNPDTRRIMLTELARVTKGPIVVSFFCSASLSAVRFKLKMKLKRLKPERRIPIPLAEFVADVKASGLKVDEVMYTQRWISSQTYLNLSRK
jgi:2-polyprenyl-3-methyl-5-hydroxy-6-metoxy-1,4-benzoquinol methylase